MAFLQPNVSLKSGDEFNVVLWWQDPNTQPSRVLVVGYLSLYGVFNPSFMKWTIRDWFNSSNALREGTFTLTSDTNSNFLYNLFGNMNANRIWIIPVVEAKDASEKEAMAKDDFVDLAVINEEINKATKENKFNKNPELPLGQGTLALIGVGLGLLAITLMKGGKR